MSILKHYAIRYPNTLIITIIIVVLLSSIAYLFCSVIDWTMFVVLCGFESIPIGITFMMDYFNSGKRQTQLDEWIKT